jgi:hypothetical protein
MTTSGTYTFSPNRADVIEDALQMLGTDVSGTDDSAIITSAGRTLNALIKALNANKTDVNVLVQTVIATVAGDRDYATDAIGVDGAYVSVNGSDFIMRPLTKAQYDAKNNKLSLGRPKEFYHDRQAGMLYLYPAPDAIYSVTYGKIRMYQDVNDSEETFDFPSSAIEMLTFGLAHRYSFKFGTDAGTQDRLEAQFLKAERKYLVANSGYTKGQTSTSTMVV